MNKSEFGVLRGLGALVATTADQAPAYDAVGCEVADWPF